MTERSDAEVLDELATAIVARGLGPSVLVGLGPLRPLGGTLAQLAPLLGPALAVVTAQPEQLQRVLGTPGSLDALARRIETRL